MFGTYPKMRIQCISVEQPFITIIIIALFFILILFFLILNAKKYVDNI